MGIVSMEKPLGWSSKLSIWSNMDLLWHGLSEHWLCCEVHRPLREIYPETTVVWGPCLITVDISKGCFSFWCSLLQERCHGKTQHRRWAGETNSTLVFTPNSNGHVLVNSGIWLNEKKKLPEGAILSCLGGTEFPYQCWWQWGIFEIF